MKHKRLAAAVLAVAVVLAGKRIGRCRTRRLRCSCPKRRRHGGADGTK